MKSLAKLSFFYKFIFQSRVLCQIGQEGVLSQLGCCLLMYWLLFTDVQVDTFLIYIPQLLKVAANQTLVHLDCGM